MSNRATISLFKKDGSVEQIYCHKEGNISKAGVILFLFYKDEPKIEKLIDLKAIISLCEEVSTTAISFYKEEIADNITQKLKCDGEVNSENFPTYKDYLSDRIRTDFDYLYDANKKKWFLIDRHCKTIDLEKMIEKEIACGEISGDYKDLFLIFQMDKEKSKEFKILLRKMLTELDF